MKIVQFIINDERVRVGVLTGENVIDLNASDGTVPNSLVELLSEGDALERIQK